MLVCALAAFAASAAAASHALAWPAIDEYSLRPPSADGKPKPGQEQPQPQPGVLSPPVQQGLSAAKDGGILGTIATAQQLGAPPTTSVDPEELAALDSAEDRSLPAAAFSALGEPGGIAILGALALLAASAFFLRRRAQ